MTRIRKQLAALSMGGTAFGWLQAFQGLDFASLITSFLASLLSAIVAALVGGLSGGTGA